MGALMNLFNDVTAGLANAANFAGYLPVGIQIAWVVLLGWAVVQIVWFARVRAALSVPPLVDTPKPRPRPVKKKVEAASAPSSSSGDLLQDLGVQVHASSAPLDSAYR
jgi:hypothetical protein